MSEPAPKEDAVAHQIMSEHLSGALQEAWNEWCNDTGCVPDGFTIHGPSTTRVTADFSHGMQFVRNITSALGRAGYRIVKNDSDHYVNFTEDTWFIEHSLDCRIAGTLGTCEFNYAIGDLWVESPAILGRWRIVGLDSEGIPSLESYDDGS